MATTFALIPATARRELQPLTCWETAPVTGRVTRVGTQPLSKELEQTPLCHDLLLWAKHSILRLVHREISISAFSTPWRLTPLFMHKLLIEIDCAEILTLFLSRTNKPGMWLVCRRGLTQQVWALKVGTLQRKDQESTSEPLKCPAWYECPSLFIWDWAAPDP